MVRGVIRPAGVLCGCRRVHVPGASKLAFCVAVPPTNVGLKKWGMIAAGVPSTLRDKCPR